MSLSVAELSAVRVLIVDDQKMVCEAVRQVLAPYAHIAFCAVTQPEAFLPTALRFAPTVILLDLDLAREGLDGLDLAQEVRACPQLQDVPLVVLSATERAETKQLAFEQGVNDYVVKLPETPELLARIHYHSKGYTNLLQRKAAQSALNFELEEGSRYISSLFPPPIAHKGVRVQWRFEACTRLAGDAFGYNWDDDDHFLFGLHDVCGHGVASALHSVSVLNLLRARALVRGDFYDPADVLTRLNEVFDMDRHNGLFLTLWYGVYQPSRRLLRYACGGHPPPLLFDPASPQGPRRLDVGGMVMGVDGQATYTNGEVVLPPGARLYMFSDGVYEVERADGSGQIGYAAFEAYLAQAVAEGTATVDSVAEWVRSQQGAPHFEDDFTLLEVLFE